jgi:hypothetical protein
MGDAGAEAPGLGRRFSFGWRVSKWCNLGVWVTEGILVLGWAPSHWMLAVVGGSTGRCAEQSATGLNLPLCRLWGVCQDGKELRDGWSKPQVAEARGEWR